MRPILSATGTYNFNLAKWLEEKLKPLSVNEYTITDVFDFADEIRSSSMNEEDILVSYDVTALFTNVPLSETIDILVDKAFTNDWFNQTYDLNLEKEELTQLLEVATTNQLFQFDGQLYEQTDGVAMGSPLGPLMANVFMCHLEDKLARDGMVPSLYKRYVNDTLARMPNNDAAAEHKYSSIGKHLLEAHGDKNLLNEGQFRVLKKCHGKFDCFVYEMLFIQELKPSLNTQSDSISAKLFV
ncbi:uncharacterized protein [Montipora capricornis]|uniref:uncharacterized protein n=1 Tax=Montipora capricornis TaxID=246305 RepID=UPI0035F1641B